MPNNDWLAGYAGGPPRKIPAPPRVPTDATTVAPVRRPDISGLPAAIPAAFLRGMGEDATQHPIKFAASMVPYLGEGIALHDANQLRKGGHPIAAGVTAAMAALPFLGGPAGSAARTIFRDVTPEEFDTAVRSFAEAKPSQAPFLTMRTPEQMRAQNMRTLLSPDGKAGYALADLGDGRVDIRNVFNHGAPGQGSHGIADALARGGNVLDHFDTKLGDIYRKFGFQEYTPPGESASRLSFDPKYAPADWDYAKYGNPDVAFQRHPLAGRLSADEYLARYQAAGDPAALKALPRRTATPLPAPDQSLPAVLQRTARRAVNRDRRAPETSTWAPEAPAVHVPQWQPTRRGVFDASNDALMYREPRELPFVPQSSSDFQGLSPVIDRIATDPGVRKGLQGDVEKGLRVGGLTWYGTRGIRDRFDELGLPNGFRDFNAAGAAGSAQTPTHNELTNASILLYAQAHGITPKAAKMAFISQYGEPLGLMRPTFMDGAGSAHVVPYERYQDRGFFAPEKLGSGSLKTPSYMHDRNLGAMGVALDAHEKRRLSQLTGIPEDVVSEEIDRNATSYLAATTPYRRIAANLGIHPDQVQASRWLGGGLLTGLKSQPTGDFLQTVEDGLLYTARTLGQGESPHDLRGLFDNIAQGRGFFFPTSKAGGFPVY